MSRDVKAQVVALATSQADNPIVRPGTVFVGLLIPEDELQYLPVTRPVILNLPEAKNAS